MKSSPILFSAAMVRAILAGTKTQTRRVVKCGQPIASIGSGADWDRWKAHPDMGNPVIVLLGEDGRPFSLPCPYGNRSGKPGGRLWVREAFSGLREYAAEPPSAWGPNDPIWYWADGNPESGDWTKPRPSIHMPRFASRITLEITGVRVERLQDISEADAQAEGCSLECMTPTGGDSGSAIYGPGGYLALWEGINGAGSWDANPWVWVIEFKRAST